ncbi:MAG: hypothetical protein L0241_00320 [Planctomycetia bacterium]|nr:hypothetical protein [Planctomycetia bacterium]
MSQPSCLVQFGRSGFVGRFTSSEPVARGERVIVRGSRGVELGVVLCEPEEKFTPSLATEGELLRIATSADEALIQSAPKREAEFLSVASSASEARGLPLTFVDAELTLDDHLILHGLAWGECDATPLFEELSTLFNLSVRLLDLSRAPVSVDPKQAEGCGKPGCGSQGGGCSSCSSESGEKSGCSSGSCSRGSVKSAEDMTAYFADLRKKMESAGLTRTPLH